MEDFPRIKRLPPYVFAIVNDLKAEARARGEDIIDFGMGNPDGATPRHIVDKAVEALSKPRNHRYSVSRGLYKLRLAATAWYKRKWDGELDADTEMIVTMGAIAMVVGNVLAVINNFLLVRTFVYRFHPEVDDPD